MLTLLKVPVYIDDVFIDNNCDGTRKMKSNVIQNDNNSFQTPSTRSSCTLLPFVLTLGFGGLLLFSPMAHATPDFEKMADVIYKIEGAEKTRHPFGVLSVPCKGYDECRRITVNSLKNSWKRYQKTDKTIPFDQHFANRWCPVGAENDPQGLNKNWLYNFRFYMEKL